MSSVRSSNKPGLVSGLHILLIMATLLAGFIFISCSDDPFIPPEPQGTVLLEQMDATFTSVEVRLRTDGFGSRFTLRLLVHDSVWTEGMTCPTDTLLTISDLMPSTSYSVHIEVLEGEDVKHTGKPSQLRTKDTLSTDYELRAFECGVQTGNLDDAIYYSRDDVWATGEFSAWNDSAGKRLDYNAVHWDGASVTYYRIPFYNYVGDFEYFGEKTPITRVHEFKGDLWFFSNGAGATVFREGRFIPQRFGKESNSSGGVFSTWSDANGLYVGCYDGSVRKLSGDKFVRIVDTQDKMIVSLHGYRDTVYALSNGRASDEYGTVYRVVGSELTKMEGMKPPRGAIGMWISPEGRIYIGGPGPHYWDGEHWVEMAIPTNKYFDALSGTGEDRIFMANAQSLLAHFNGYSWNLIPGAASIGGICYNIKAGLDGFCAVGRSRNDVPMFIVGVHK
jgi:hypothetical protein